MPRHEGLKDVLFGAPGEWRLVQCAARGCATLWLDPQPLADDIGVAYERYYTHGDTEPGDSAFRRLYRCAKRGYVAWRYGYPASWPCRVVGVLLHLLPGRRLDADCEVMFLPAIEGGRLLEVGCGSGRQLANMRDLGWVTIGVDLDQQAVAAARAKNLDVRVGTLDDQVFAAGSFDAVVLNNVVEHVYDAAGLLRAVHHVLAPGGRVIVLTPNPRGLGHRWFGKHWRGLEPPRHIAIFTAASLAALARGAGFSDVDVTATVRNSRWIFVASRAIRAAYEGGRDEALVASPGIAAEWFQVTEWALSLLWHEAGEELLLVARK
jgi:2-polyprenyl-3-methyl-5-hydroxy-6-metoxy-1,4-benzoquinol methylase